MLTPHQVQCIHSLIRDCGQLAQKMAAEPFQVYEKGVADYVTNVDRTLDRKLAAGLMSLFPGDRIITEENSESWRSFLEPEGAFWFIDPLDGTDDFIHHKPHYAVMVGLLEQHQPIAGWVGAPAFDRLYYGGQDWGLFEVVGDRGAEPLLPKEPPPPSTNHCPILLGYKDQKRYGDAIQQFVPAARFDSIGSFGLKVLRVIGGEAGIYIYLNRRVKLWDTTGPLAMAKAAGLVCCDLAGNPLRFTPDAINLDTLAHRQTIVVGWQSYVETLLEPLQKAIAQVGLLDQPS
ncbi:3'(2'),5'-bisphosphate nucleotidase CysQ family protein [Leptolyngbya ohadii]|uniref:3'(2'),5'-bisphosphate nucleotidase CysQ family protein n=1 Tax=Leptolyngbya ohadii TaxID=1962290 RepID=UPI000B59E0BE|nr:inositol monophosphatase family protein [Leptolyngbya ohadii]